MKISLARPPLNRLTTGTVTLHCMTSFRSQGPDYPPIAAPGSGSNWIRDLDTYLKQESFIIRVTPKVSKRKEQFEKLGKAISQLTPNEIAWRDHLEDHAYITCNGDTRSDPEHPREVWGGPKFKTPQWIRTVRVK